ncbi:hypothetical protein L3X38_003346 [Prunus dulcis]|uniref:EF-hand domain-containing protein n=1 Tax=Prunus dulcis TaxID=3755 RepID=A0AAD4ZLX5_PRUDU|nr:hypothetical protein L3X38_003346 [Prunus dulcis]
MDSDGSLTRLELAGLLRSLGFKLIGDVVLVANRNGTVEFDELVTTILPNMNDEILINQEELMETKKEIVAMWKKLDVNQKTKYEPKNAYASMSKKNSLKIGTRCSPKDLKDTISVLCDEKKNAILEMGFGSLLAM